MSGVHPGWVVLRSSPLTHLANRYAGMVSRQLRLDTVLDVYLADAHPAGRLYFSLASVRPSSRVFPGHYFSPAEYLSRDDVDAVLRAGPADAAEKYVGLLEILLYRQTASERVLRSGP